jgi:hypothetical protein
VGDGDGVATAAVEIDDVWVTDWQSGPLGTHRTATGYVSLGRLSEGPHTILVYVDPGSGQHDQQTTTVELP